MEEATGKEPDIPAPDSVQESDSFDNKEEDNKEWEDPFDPFSYNPGLRRSTGHTAGVPLERLNYDTGLESSVIPGNDHITAPSSYTEAMGSEHKQYWHKAMKDEFTSLNESNVWKLVTIHTNRKAIPVGWTFDIKVDWEDVITQFEARLVRKGFMQVEGVNYRTTVRCFIRYQGTIQ